MYDYTDFNWPEHNWTTTLLLAYEELCAIITHKQQTKQDIIDKFLMATHSHWNTFLETGYYTLKESRKGFTYDCEADILLAMIDNIGTVKDKINNNVSKNIKYAAERLSTYDNNIEPNWLIQTVSNLDTEQFLKELKDYTQHYMHEEE